MFFSCSDNDDTPIEDALIEANLERSINPISLYESESFKKLMSTLTIDSQFLMTYNTFDDSKELDEYHESFGVYVDEINRIEVENLSVQNFKDIANATFGISFDDYIDLMYTSFSDFFSEHQTHFISLTEEERTSLMSEAVEMYLINDLGLSLENLTNNGRSDCDHCHSAYSNCQDSHNRNFAIGVTGTFVTGFGIGIGTGWTGPGALGFMGIYWLGSGINDFYDLAIGSMDCYSEYRDCMRDCNGAGGGNEGNGPIPFGGG